MSSNMYGFISVFIVAVFCAAPTLALQPPNITTVSQTCTNTETNATIQYLTTLLTTTYEITATWPTPIMCFMSCVGKGIGLINTDNTLNTAFGSTIFSGATGTRYANLLTYCKSNTPTNTDACIQATWYANCMRLNGWRYMLFTPVIMLWS